MKNNIALIAFMAASPIQAQQFGSIPLHFCGDTDTVRTMAQEHYGEQSVFKGIYSPVHVDELFIDPIDGSYTFMRSNIKTGQTCVIAAGIHGMNILTPRKPNL